MTPNFKGFLSQIESIDFLYLSLEKESVLPFYCWVGNKGITGTIFITSFVLDWGLNQGPPALEASTLPLGLVEEAVYQAVKAKGF